MLKSILQPVLNPVISGVLGDEKLIPRPPTFLGSKLIRFLDSSDTSKMTLSGNEVINITDKSSLSQLFIQPTQSQRATLTADGFNFVGANSQHYYCDITQNSTTETLFFRTGGFRVFSVSKVADVSTGAGRVLLSENNNTADSNPRYNYLLRSSVSGQRNSLATIYRNNTSGSIILSGTSTTISTPLAFDNLEFNAQGIQDNGTNEYKGYVNGVLCNTTSYSRTGTLININRVTFGGERRLNFTAGTGWDSVCKYLVGTTNDLTTSEEQEVWAWIMINAGISHKLPNNNPFK